MVMMTDDHDGGGGGDDDDDCYDDVMVMITDDHHGGGDLCGDGKGCGEEIVIVHLSTNTAWSIGDGHSSLEQPQSYPALLHYHGSQR